ncbi:MAG: SBBP repeat-containing protein, partial [Candidatus Aureabacteria bacterium]|nr:SBBP repeat-containing protein [Candidatus Auribacterota bacterium]
MKKILAIGAIVACVGFVPLLPAATLQPEFSTYLGGGAWQEGRSIAVDSSGVYICGWTGSNDFPTANAYQANNQGGSDAVVIKLSSTGSTLIYATYLGGVNDDLGHSIAVENKEVYVAGQTYSPNFPTCNAYQGVPAWSKLSTGFVTKLSATGNW